MMDSIHGSSPTDPAFPHAPEGWTRDAAADTASAEGLSPSDDHWEVVRALQEYFARHDDAPNIILRELCDALEEKFHISGGMEHLYELFPGGPVSQGCRIAGLEPPPNITDPGVGSVS